MVETELRAIKKRGWRDGLQFHSSCLVTVRDVLQLCCSGIGSAEGSTDLKMSSLSRRALGPWRPVGHQQAKITYRGFLPIGGPLYSNGKD